jgi:glycosyltransferase involved in cell wall biosynthesis
MTNNDLKVLFFTGSYPFSSAAEDTFIDPELPYLKSSFNTVIIIPKSLEGKRSDLPQQITVETTLGQQLKLCLGYLYKIKTILLCLTSFIFYKEILKKSNKTLHIQSIIRVVYILGAALRTKKWIIKYIEDNKLDLAKTIFYTYWLDEISMGIYLAKMKYLDIKIISRAHGIDLYEERSSSSYIPFRPEIFSRIDQVFTDSEKGKQYLSSRYPTFNEVFSASRLGVPEQKFLTNSSQDEVFRIVTCSYLVPVKRIELLIMGLAELGKYRKDQIFEWTHIGDGPLRSELEHIARTQLPQNVEYKFLGFVPGGGVISFYQNNPIDVFINVSSSEGTPVSIMESQSCSIPVIATAVGGNSEIVTNENGILLSENPEPGEIANAICILLNDRNLLQDKKKKSYENWYNKYNSEKNFQDFIRDLMDIINNNKES